MLNYTTHTTLLRDISAGRETAWAEFCDRYGELIQSFARRLGHQSADCDDILQDVLLGLTKTMPGFAYDPAKGKFRSYLKTVAVHAAGRKTFQKPPDVPLERVEAHVSETMRDSEINQVWEGEWRQYHLRLAMQTIRTEFNESDRQGYQIYAVDGRDVNYAAEMLNMSVDQVYKAKSRITKRLTELIARQVAEEG